MPGSKSPKNQRMSDHFAPISFVVIHPHFRTGGKAFDWSNALNSAARTARQQHFWRCSDSLSLREFLRLASRDAVEKAVDGKDMRAQIMEKVAGPQ